ncbi:MAG TPA: aspartate carbamoyltransferase [Geobacterales bacterium]|nr:aspartate carbamoyltransferase [Geobacterales bacterium]
MAWKNRDVVSIDDFSKEDLEALFKKTDEYEHSYPSGILKGKIIGNIFLEYSTRTRVSFEVAAKRLGAEVINLVAEYSSIKKGESLYDTLKMMDIYSDLLVIRSPIEGTARFASDVCKHPVINAGDGYLNHPTQAMIDLYTIRKLKGRLDDLRIGVCGDLRYGRAAVSFMFGVAKYSNKIYAISPAQLSMREDVKNKLTEIGAYFVETNSLEEVLPELDVLYVTRIQKERFPDIAEYEKVKGSYKVDLKTLQNSKRDLIVMHPLPRVDELSYEIDNTPMQAYFKQAELGVYIRMALLSLILVGE